MRLASGDRPFLDEMNIQVLGSLAAVPFTWVWLQFFDVESIVLASRVFYLFLLFMTAIPCYRGLRTRLPRTAAFCGVSLMLIPAPYNLLVTSYNTMPILALSLATCAGFAALSGGSSRWAATAGAALSVAVLSHPSALPAAAALGLTILVLGHTSRPVRGGLLLGGVSSSLFVLLWLALGPGLTSLLDTLTYTTDYQSTRPAPGMRLTRALGRYLEGLFSWRHLSAGLLALVALAPVIPQRVRPILTAGIPVAIAIAAWLTVPPTPTTREPFGLTSGAFVLLVAPLLALPVAHWALKEHDTSTTPRSRRSGGPSTPKAGLRLLLLLTLPLAVVGFVSFSMVSSAGVTWGVAAPAVQPLLGALGAGLVLWTRERSGIWMTAAVCGAVVTSLLAVHPLRTLTNPDPRNLIETITEGPMAGLRTDANGLRVDCELRSITRAWLQESDSIFFYGRAGGYVYETVPMATNILWLSDFGVASQETVDWWQSRDRWPDLIIVHLGPYENAAAWEDLAAENPVVESILVNYPNRVRDYEYLVMRKDGTTPSALGADLHPCHRG